MAQETDSTRQPAAPASDAPAIPTCHAIKVEFSGDVFLVNVALEGELIPLVLDPADGNWKSKLFAAFPVVGDMDTYLFCKGINGTAWKLQLCVDKRSAIREGVIRKGFGYLGEQIALPLPDVGAKP